MGTAVSVQPPTQPDNKVDAAYVTYNVIIIVMFYPCAFDWWK